MTEENEANSQSNETTTDSRSGGIYFGNQAIVQGDIIGGNKYEVRFYALSSNPEGNRISWGQYRREDKPNVEEPYKFLSYYDTTDADIFFGREVVSDLLVSKISSHRLVLVNGKSGSGKTSLINAGIIPRLVERGYFTVVLRDYGYPTDIIKSGINSLDNVDINLSNCHTLKEVLYRVRRDAQRPLTIFLDQFERFFLNLSLSQQSQFIHEFGECISTLKAQEVSFVISIRQDFYGNLGAFWKDSPEFNTESYRHYLEPLDREEAIVAIKKPLQRLYPNIIYDPDFLEQQLLPHLLRKTTETTDEQVEPVHLQIVCNRLFDEVRTRNQEKLQEGETVIIKENLYQELGGVQGILQGYVDSILEQFTSKERDEAKTILKQMVSAQGTRTFKSLNELTAQLGIPETEIEKIIEKLDRGRLIETVPSERKYSLTHEYLVQKVNQWYDIRELELKKAKELFDRCLINWNLYNSLIPRNQFREIKKYKSYLNLNADGENLLKRSSWAYYGVNGLLGLLLAGLSLSGIDQIIHRFYLQPKAMGRLEIKSTTGQVLNQNAKIFSIENDGKKRQLPIIWSLPYFNGIPKGLYYIEIEHNGYIIKHPVKVEGYKNYIEPVAVRIPLEKISANLIKDMAFVPGGKFVIGDKVDTTNKQNQSVMIDSFYIDKYEVTNQEYEEFIKAIEAAPSSYQVFYNGQPEYKRDKNGHQPGNWKEPFYQKYSRTDRNPVINVDWYDAFAYCAWQGKRLPTVLEWEKAASGRDQAGNAAKFAYPWGNDPDFTRANTIDKWTNPFDRATEEVNRYPEGSSFYGVLNMIGNAFEWTDIWYVEPILNKDRPTTLSNYREQSLKGGSFGQPQLAIPIYESPLVDASQRDLQYGFRCAISKSDDQQ